MNMWACCPRTFASAVFPACNILPPVTKMTCFLIHVRDCLWSFSWPPVTSAMPGTSCALYREGSLRQAEIQPSLCLAYTPGEDGRGRDIFSNQPTQRGHLHMFLRCKGAGCTLWPPYTLTCYPCYLHVSFPCRVRASGWWRFLSVLFTAKSLALYLAHSRAPEILFEWMHACIYIKKQ